MNLTRRQIARAGLGAVATGAPSRPLGSMSHAAARTGRAGDIVEISVAPTDREASIFDPHDFGFVGIYDIDWLGRPGFSQLLDNLAASPNAFRGVRCFGVFTAGSPERFLPEDAGTIWSNADAPMDFSAAFDALAELTSRRLTPFIPFGFFPPAVSSSILRPPSSWSTYQSLVRNFLLGLAEDSRFGPEAIAAWWFEAWNEPNEGRFWDGSREDFFSLYRATSEAIAQTGLSIRFGGPAIAYKPQVSPADGAPWMEQFLRFIASEPTVQCDFISYHRKGTVTDDDPNPRLVHEAAVTTARQMQDIDAARFAGMPIINNEADEKVGFEQPYAPRLDERNASWLSTVAVIHASLTRDFGDAGFRFIGAADNANLQLVEAPFDGRRSIMTHARNATTDLLKIPAYAYYELLPLLGDHIASVEAGADALFPETDMYHLTAFSDTHVGCLLTHYPDPGRADRTTRALEIAVTGIPWDRVNVARFQIDHTLSNAYAAAGGTPSDPFPVPDPADLGRIRQAQELAVAQPIEHDVAVERGTYRQRLDLAPYTTVLLWITPVETTVPEPPRWITSEVLDGNVVLQWEPALEPDFYSFEVLLMSDGQLGDRLSPMPLRSAMWVDTAPPPGPRRYGVRTITASGAMSPITLSDEIVVP